MKKSLFFVALGALALTSCSQDEVLEVQKDAVSFSVVADNAGRATVTNTNSITAFNVTAFNASEDGANATTFMNAVEVTKNNAGVWDYASHKFWPTEGKINFYSYSPSTLTGVAIAKNAQTITYSVPTKCADQIDVLYALNTGLGKANGEVKVNFRHALSQIVFHARCPKTDLEVEIAGVRVVNVLDRGVLSWPTLATTTQIVLDENGNEADLKKETETDDSWGEWDLTTGQLAAYPAELQNEKTTLKATPLTISNTVQPLLLMPQEIVPATVDATGKYMDYTKGGTFFAIKCKIYSVEGTGDAAVKTLLWPSTEGYAEVVIPATSPDTNDEGKAAWLQGRKYVYTFVFGEGAGYVGPNGSDPEDPTNPDDPTQPVDPEDPETPAVPTDPTDPNEPGEPVLVPVTFTVTVDQFQTATQVVDMATK